MKPVTGVRLLRTHATSVVMIVTTAGVTAYGVYSTPDRTWPNLLIGGFSLTSVAVSAIAFLAVQRLSGARWSASLRRIPEAVMSVLPAAALLMLGLLLGRQWLYPWSHPGAFAHTPAIAGKVQYLQFPFVVARMVAVLLAWGIFAVLFRRASLEQDRHPGASLRYDARLNRYAALFVQVFALSFTLAANDWIGSVDPGWFSTIFALYLFAGAFVQGIAAITFATILVRERGLLREYIDQQRLHDLGKMLFAFSTFWAYLWTCQYLLIWYGNIPEEVTHYVTRTNGPWLILFLLNPAINWLIPFIVLLSSRAKRSAAALGAMSLLLLAGRWLDLYVLVMPSLWSGPRFGLPEIAVAVGCGALLYLAFVRSIASAPVVPLADPVLTAQSPSVVIARSSRWLPPSA